MLCWSNARQRHEGRDAQRCKIAATIALPALSAAPFASFSEPQPPNPLFSKCRVNTGMSLPGNVTLQSTMTLLYAMPIATGAATSADGPTNALPNAAPPEIACPSCAAFGEPCQ